MPISDTRRAYLREYQRNWIRERREAWLREHGPCVFCGSGVQLELDHKDSSTKQIESASIWSMSPGNPRRVQELEKCQVLCHVCHTIKASKEKAKGEQVGKARLTEAEVITIRRLHKQGLTYRKLAPMFNVYWTAIAKICTQKTWKHVK